jgi:hypothetical protein
MHNTLLIGTFVALATFGAESHAAASKYTASSTITVSGITYNYSGTSTCTDGTAAMRHDRKWWCPVVQATPEPAPAPVLYNAQLSWAAPTTRADGTLLAAGELAGYEVYYTNAAGSVSVALPISGGSTLATTVPSLSSGSYSFSISAVDANGLKSALSPVVTVNFP